MSLLNRVKTAVRPIIGGLPDRLHQRRRIRELEASLEGQSVASLAADLDRLPIPPGATVLVHSSLKALGYVEGGADAAIDALVEAIVARRRGTVMLPTFSIDGSMHRTLTAGRVFDQRSTPSNLGALPEAFRRHPRARRSLHPTHSFAAIGLKAKALVDGHHLAKSSFGEGSPMANLLAADGYLLGLGTDLGRVTFYHCLEEIEDSFPLDVFTPDSPIGVTCIGDDGASHKLTVSAHDPELAKRRIDHPNSRELRAFFQDRFERQAGLAWYQVGEARSWLIEAGKLYAEIKHLMQTGITIYSNASDLAAHRQEAIDCREAEPA